MSTSTVGAASSTLNSNPRFVDTFGKVIKNSVVTISDSGVLALPSNAAIFIGASDSIQHTHGTGLAITSPSSGESTLITANQFVKIGQPIDLGNAGDTFMRRSAANTIHFDRNGSGSGAINLNTNGGTVFAVNLTQGSATVNLSSNAITLTTGSNQNITNEKVSSEEEHTLIPTLEPVEFKN